MLQCVFKEEVEWGLHEGPPSVRLRDTRRLVEKVTIQEHNKQDMTFIAKENIE